MFDRFLARVVLELGDATPRVGPKAFLGALSERRAIKGVFITTSSFSKEARACAVRASDNLVLIDGEELAELMLENSVGVTVRETFSQMALDGGYFEDG